MLALLCTLSLFTLWSLTGWGLLCANGPGGRLRRHLLLAPAVGLAWHVVGLFILSRLGWPIRTVAWPWVAITVLAAGVSISRAGALREGRRLAPYLPLLGAALLLCGWPVLRFGWDWLSFCNDDMANYVLASHRFADFGFFAPPDPQGYARVTDLSQSFWFMHVLDSSRCGAELLLAMAETLWQRNGLEVFMPTILALHLTVLCSAGALAGRRLRAGSASWWTMLLLGGSAVATFGVLYQLIAQTLGLALWAALAAVTLRSRAWQPTPGVLSTNDACFIPDPTQGASPGSLGPSKTSPERPERYRPLLRLEALTGGLLLAALAIGYTEVVPFFVLSALVYGSALGMDFYRTHQSGPLRSWLTRTGGSLFVALVLLHSATPHFFDYLAMQVANARVLGGYDVVMFPAFLIPSGLMAWWGLITVNAQPAGSWQDVGILLGGLALGGTVVVLWRRSRRLDVAALTGALLLAASGASFGKRNGFALYKLTMYSQPFVMAALAAAGIRVLRFKGHNPAALPRMARGMLSLVAVGWLGCNLVTQQHYVRSSQGLQQQGGGAFVEIGQATPRRLVSQLKAVTRQTLAGAVLVDTSNVVTYKLVALSSRGKSLYSPTFSTYPTYATHNSLDKLVTRLWYGVSPQLRALGQRVCQAVHPLEQHGSFRLQPTPSRGAEPTNAFDLIPPIFSPGSPQSPTLLVEETAPLSILNRQHKPLDAPGCVTIETDPGATTIRNHLHLIPSELGYNNYSSKRGKAAIFQMEPDGYFSGRRLAGLGRHAWFWIDRPSPQVRLCLELSCTLQKGRGSSLPPACAIGASRVPLPLVGRGAARVFSPPLTPQMVLQQPFVGIDLGTEGETFPTSRRGLMQLYGNDIDLDWRRLVAFGRDISVVSEQEYEARSTPCQVRLPADLTQPTFEYSGLYEDGWVGEASTLTLNSTAQTRRLHLRGLVPQVGDAGYSTTLRVCIDGLPVCTRHLGLGSFEIDAAVALRPGRHRVELAWSRTQRFAEPDGRPVAARLDEVGLDEGVVKAAQVHPSAPDLPR